MSFIPNNVAHEIKSDKSGKKINICIAALNVEIICPFCTHFYDFREYMQQFDEPDVSIYISQKDLDQERLLHPEILNPAVSVDNDKVTVTYDYGCLEPFVALRKTADAVLPFDVFLFHGAVVEKDGYAYIFTAPSGTGKSTRIQLWLEKYPDSTVVNGDKPFIKITDDDILACGSPWSGKEGWNTNTMVPLRAIFLLERDDDHQGNLIEEIGIGKAFPFLLQQLHCPKNPDALRKTIQLIQSLHGKVRFYRFRSAPTKEAVQLAYETARPRE